MKIRIIYFSQTGNTRKVARAMAETLDQAGHEVDVRTLKKARPDETSDCDLLGVGTPCFSSRAPAPVRRFLSSLPDLSGRSAFVFATSGGGPGRVLFDQADIIRQKNAGILGGIIIRGECFHPFPEIKGRFPGRPDPDDLAIAASFAALAAAHVSAGGHGPVPGSRADALKPGGFYNRVGLINTDDALRKILKAPQASPEKCNRCRWCEYACPTSSISLDPYPAITGDACLRCYRCLTGCPRQAFSADMRLGNLLSIAFYNTLFERWLGDVKPGEKFY